MELIATSSSMFDGYGYNAEHQVLVVRYRGTGDTYAYQEISPELYEEFAEAKSHGSFFNENIKGKFTAIKEEALKAQVHVSEVAHLSAEQVAEMAKEPSPDGVVGFATSVPQSRPGLVETTQRHICKECGVNLDDDQPCYACGCPQEPEEETVVVTTVIPGPITVPNPAESVPLYGITDKPKSVTDEVLDGLNVALAIPPKVMAEPSVPTTPEEAIALLSEERGFVGATIAQAKDASTQALAVVVKDAESYKSAGELVIRLTGMKDRGVKFLDPIREVLYKPYQTAQKKLKEFTDPLDSGLTHLKRQRVTFSNEQDRLAELERQRLQREVDEQARKDREAASKQLTEDTIQERLDLGDTAGAEALKENPIVAAPVYVPPVRVEPKVEKTEGISKRKNWKAEVPGYPESTTEFEKLVLSVAEGICELASKGTLGGFAPIKVLMPNMTALNQLAKAQEKSFSLPGVRVFNDATEVSRRGRS